MFYPKICFRKQVIGFAFGMFNTRYNQYVFFCYQGFEAMNRSIE